MPPVRIRRWAVSALTLAALSAPLRARCQLPASAADRPSPAAHEPNRMPPELHLRRELAVGGFGAGLLVAGALVSVDEQVVPPAGLDPATIGWQVDRDVVGNRSLDANTASNWTRNGALLFPVALALVTGSPGHRLTGVPAWAAEYVETMLASQGPTLLVKSLTSRARPYAYLPLAQRPSDPSFDVSQSRTFASMPSGHSSSAWTGAALGMTEDLLSRPRARWEERVLVGFVGAGLAGATSALRVQAGQHFPSDVLAGAGLGVMTGIAVPFLHRDGRPLPSTKAVLEMLGGAVAGTVAGVAASR